MLLFVSFPLGIFVVFESEIGGDINYEYPLTHLELFESTGMYQASIDVSIGDVFVVLWTSHIVIFVIAALGPRQRFSKSLSSIIYFGRYDHQSNYMIGVITWFSILILVSALINFIQEGFGIRIIPPPADNDLVEFFYVSLAPLVEETGFRLILIGIPLFVIYSNISSAKYFFRCLWNPATLDIHDSRKAVFLIIFVGIIFGFVHIAVGESWSEGKFAQAAASGIILGWVYLRYGFVAALLIHWATNYFVFSYAGFISQLNFISFEDAFSHSLMLSLELIFLMTGALSISMLLVCRFYSKKESTPFTA